ncbi:MAG: hypothetical protein VZR13_01495 [Saccharofermentanaceae bacterium]|nr:hypothetical protein [Saccharofermentanaceae bacterium]HAU50396.1 hypothetical protein [Clostridiales bacterium]HBZ78726.1 hypothetical protein [Clostridiales bacterium]
MRVYNDVIVEKIVAKHLTAKDKLCRVIFVILAVLAIFLINFIPLLFGIIYLMLLTVSLSFGIGFLCYLMVSGIVKEYEYSVVNDEFSVDVISGKKRRSNLFSGSIREFDMIAKINDEMHPVSEFEKGALRAYCASGINKENEWYIAAKMETQKVLVIIEPDERFLTAFFRYNPRNTMYRPTSKPNSKPVAKQNIKSKKED